MAAARREIRLMAAERDPYVVLGVPPGATTEQVTAAYRRLARRHHPDVSGDGGAERRMAEINAAWTVLRDPARRASWDREHGIVSRGSAAGGGPAGYGSTRAGDPDRGTTGMPWPSSPGTRTGPVAWRRGPDGEGAAGPPPGNPRGSVLPFGRHIGWSLGEIARVDPGYLAWLEGRREGAPYRDEIQALLAATRPRAGDAPEGKRRSFR
jgi:curved DNA-binding protein CbpA